MDQDVVIRTVNLTKCYKQILAVDNLNLAVEGGTIFGFLGHNGAGKTTTIGMLSGQLLPTSGHAEVLGYDVVRQRQDLARVIGVVFEQQNLYERLTGRDNLLFFARLYGVEARKVDQLLGMVGLAQRAKDSVKKYSNGMRQRVLIARALLNDPKALFLDEPTKGLDPVSAREIRSLIGLLKQEGCTVFLTTHYMEEADQLCDTVAFMSEGKIVALDSPQSLKVKYGRRLLRVKLKDDDPLASTGGNEMVFSLDSKEDSESFRQLWAGDRILTVHSDEATLEEVFLKLAGRPLE